MKRTVKCPWCYEPTIVDEQRHPLGDPAVMAHLNRCPIFPAPVPPSPEGSDGNE